MLYVGFFKFLLMKLVKMFKRPTNYIPDACCNNCGKKTILMFKESVFDGMCNTCHSYWFNFSAMELDSKKTIATAFLPVGGPDMGSVMKYLDSLSALPTPYENVFGHPGELKTPLMKASAQLKLIESKPREKKELCKITEPVSLNLFPEDYQECAECGYDHRYDASSAARKHLG